MVRCTPENEFKGLVCRNFLQNCPVTTKDITNAYNNFYPDIVTLKVNMTGNTPRKVVMDHVTIPEKIKDTKKCDTKNRYDVCEQTVIYS